MRMRISLSLAFAAVSVLLVALMQPSLALADDATPPPPITTPTSIPTPTPIPEIETEEVPEQPQEEAAGEPAEEPAEEPAQAQSEEPAEEPAEELDLPEILEQAPSGTEVVVLDENGEPQALATEDAMEILLNGDPVWCPAAQLTPTPGLNGCTAGATSFATLLTQLDGTFTGAGTIWVAFDYDATLDTAAIDFNGSTAGLSVLTDLTVQGGWDGVSGSSTITGTPSTLDDALSIVNWQGNVTLNDLIITADDGFAGLEIRTDGDIDLDNVDVTDNTGGGSGAYLDTCAYNGATGLCAGTGSITVNDGSFSDNDFNGLVTDSGGDTDLTDVTADSNGLRGALISGNDDDGTGDVTVTTSDFTNNASGTGLEVRSDGNVTLNTVVADSNFTGMYIDSTYGTGTITVDTNSQANSNTGTGLHAVSNGDITVSQFTANLNDANGAYLFAYGSGNIFVNTNSSFTENGEYGLFAKTFGGDITLDNMDVDGNSVTKVGAFLKTHKGGNVIVDTSTFNNNTLSGLVVASSGQVDLNDVTADNNGKNGTEVYSTYTYSCHGDNNITVNVDAGTFTNNLFYGLYVVPGATGTLVFVNPATYLPANGSGDYLLVLENPECPKDVIPSSKTLKIVDVPFKAGPPVDQECDLYSGSKLVLPEGTSIKITCPYTGETQLEGLNEAELPGPLGAGGSFVLGVSVKFNNEGQPVDELNEGGLLTLSFEIPEDAGGRGYSILFWDPTANNGLGAWVQLPPFEFGTSFYLDPDNPDDGRKIMSGVRQQGNSVVATVNFPGIFILVSE